MELGLAGRVTLVTGGSEGIGRATALALAREGARVAICARRPDVLDAAARQIESLTGANVLAIAADVTRPDDIERTISTTAKEHGPITILVNNAGGRAFSSFEKTSDEAWAADFDSKFMAAVRASRLVVPLMRAAGGGSIVNLANMHAKQPGAGSLPTSATRAAGIALTKAMSKELAPDNIRVNAICVGLIKSAQQQRSAVQRFPGMSVDEAWERMGRGVPLGRMGEAEEVADLITFLVSDRGAYLTGTALNIDGGASAVT